MKLAVLQLLLLDLTPAIFIVLRGSIITAAYVTQVAVVLIAYVHIIVLVKIFSGLWH
jgi:hypothetical protein